MPYYKATLQVGRDKNVVYCEAPTEERCRAWIQTAVTKGLRDEDVSLQEVDYPPDGVSAILA